MRRATRKANGGFASGEYRRLYLVFALIGLGLILWIWWNAHEEPPPPVPSRPTNLVTRPSQPDGDRPPPLTNVVRVERVRPTAAPPTPETSSGTGATARLVATTNVAGPAPAPAGTNTWPQILEAQIALVRSGISPGSLDGMLGAQTRAALRAFQQFKKLSATGRLDPDTLLLLTPAPPVFTNYTVTTEDAARLLPLGRSWLAKSQQERLDFETLLELVAEKSWSHPNLIRRLNPSVDWSAVAPGTSVTVPLVEYPVPSQKAAFARILLSQRLLQAFDGATNLLAHFPCSIAQRMDKRPVGELHVAVTAPNPNYTFNPEVFPESAEARELGRKLILQPGPNNPVGTVWIGLDRSGYGIHGTPSPEQVGRTESHGCFRLANWNAEHFLKLVWVGMPVYVEP